MRCSPSWAFLIFVKVVLCGSYYIDCEGDDSNDGKSISTPWKTVNKLEEVTDFSDISSILLKTDCVWHDGHLHLESISGNSPSNPFLVSSYGGGTSNPQLRGSKPVIGEWTLESGQIYSLNVFESVKYVFVDDVKYLFSHAPINSPTIPRESFRLKNYYYVEDSEMAEDIVTIHLGSDFMDEGYTVDQVNGSRIAIRYFRYSFGVSEIVDYDTTSKTLKFIYDGFLPNENEGFLLLAKEWMVSMGTFYWDSDQTKLFLWLEDDSDPNQRDIEVTTSGKNVLSIENCHNLTVENIDIYNSGGDGIYVLYSTYVTIRNSVVKNTANEGIDIHNIFEDGMVIDSCNVLDSGVRGIICGNAVQSGHVLNSVVRNTFLFGPLQTYIDGFDIRFGHGVYMNCRRGSDCKVVGNLVENSATVGVTALMEGVLIENNIIRNGGLMMDDGALIYLRSMQPNHGYHTVRNNLLINAFGNSYGTATASLGIEGPSHGVYLDGRACYSSITDNVIINTHYGIYVHDVHFSYIENNIVFGARKAALVTSEDHGYVKYVHNNTIQNNVFHSYEKNMDIGAHYDHYDFFDVLGYNLWGKGSFNFFAPFMSPYWRSYPDLETWMDFVNSSLDNPEVSNTWHAGDSYIGERDGYEFHDHSYVALSENKVKPIVNSTEGWGKWPAASIIHEYEKNCSCMKITVDRSSLTSSYRFANSNSFSVTSGSSYHLEFEYWVGFEEIPIYFTDYPRLLIKNSSTGQNDNIITLSLPLTQFRRKFSFYFKSDVTADNIQLWFMPKGGDGGNSLAVYYYLANVKVFEADIKVNNRSDEFSVLYNTEDEERIVAGKNQYCDPNGKIIDNDIVLPRAGGIFVTNCFCNYDGYCNNHENANSCPEECDPVCGNGICEEGENDSCPDDCKYDENDEKDDEDYDRGNGIGRDVIIGIIVGSSIFAACVLVLLIVLVIVALTIIIAISKKKGGNNDSEMNEFE